MYCVTRFNYASENTKYIFRKWTEDVEIELHSHRPGVIDEALTSFQNNTDSRKSKRKKPKHKTKPETKTNQEVKGKKNEKEVNKSEEEWRFPELLIWGDKS